MKIFTESRRKILTRLCLASGVLVLGPACIEVPRTTQHDASLPRMTINGYSFHTRQVGDPGLPPLIVVHGGPGGDFHYLSHLEALSNEYSVLFYDQRDTGLSAREETAPDPEQYLSDLNDIVRLHGRGRPVRLIGHSWGAMLAAAYTGQHHSMVSHVVLAEPGILNVEGARNFVARLKDYQSLGGLLRMLPLFASAIFVRSVDGHERTDYIMTQMLGSGSGAPYHCEGQSLPPHSFLRGGYAAFAKTILPMMENPEIFNYDLSSGMDRYPGRVMLLSSECSFIGYEYQEKMHRPLLPRSTEHVRIQGTGHNMITMKPEESLAAIRRFLRD